MKRDIQILIVLLTLTTTAIGQVTNKFIDSGSINYQFEHLINKSNRYEDYKVVKINWLQSLKNNIADSLTKNQLTIQNNQLQMSAHVSTIDSLNTIIAGSTGEINTLKSQIESIGFFGIQIKKPFFKTVIFSIIAILLVFLFVFIAKFKRSNLMTVQTKKTLKELDEEFDTHRKRALEREQKVMRKLQDELNKQKKE